jgi:signal transduction histidine kinase
MKRSFWGLLAGKRIVLIFLLAIILPCLVIAYLSLKTFSQRRDTVQQILESNLWISGNSALKSFENALQEQEKDALNEQNFHALLSLDQGKHAASKTKISAVVPEGRYFLLDEDYRILFPPTGIAAPGLPESAESPQPPLGEAYRQAENLEFAQGNHARASELYQEASQKASSPRLKAIALEAYGRCLVSLKQYNRASEVYRRLQSEFSHQKNQAGHSLGITAALQLFDIQKQQNGDPTIFQEMLRLYQAIKDGQWLIDLPAYELFVEEIETIIEDQLQDHNLPQITASYRSLQTQKSPYLESLLFVDFLATQIIPQIKEHVIKEHVSFNPGGDEDQPQHLLARQDDQSFLVSYKILSESQSGSRGGLCWAPEFLQAHLFPRILKQVEQETGLQVRISDERGLFPSEDKISQSSSLYLSFRSFPFPWQLEVSQPGLGNLQQTAQREVLTYGILLSLIVALLILGAVLIVRDTARERESTRLKTEFVHNVSHELKTPLTLIRLYGETLQRKKSLSDEQRDECYQIITKESERLSHLINNVLDFSRIDMGRKEFDFQKGNLAEAVRETLESYRYHLEKKGFSIKTHIDPQMPQILFDREAVSSALINLLSNAEKFSPDRKEVTVRLFEKENSAVLQVSDEGIGISPKEVEKIFTRFYRASNETAAEAKGSGLGLPLVKHIAEAHGGQVDVESVLGKGATFSIILPIQVDKDKS